MRYVHRLLRWIDVETFSGIGYTNARERLTDWIVLTEYLRRGHWMCPCGRTRHRDRLVEFKLDVEREKLMAHLQRG